MQIDIAEMQRMAERGSSLLRLIQNSHTPVLDLLIRESVQNSVDAASNPKTPIKYDISVKDIETASVSKHFDGIENKLNAMFGKKGKSIIIRDSCTTGLTGPLHEDFMVDENYGNLLKLVYQISMPQEKKEAGGSWGLGKTIYFRVGIGLVVYYTRIKLDDGTYQSRLAACLVEDESRDNCLLPNSGKPKRGIAWWGQLHKGGDTMPITDELEINKILQDLQASPYTGTETGTTVIIPFVNPSKLIVKREEEARVWWHNNLELYLQVALQRWYASRIDNKFYKYGNYLLPSVNDYEITKENMEPVFSIIRSLYIAASASNKNNESLGVIDLKDIFVKEIKLRNTLENTVAGKVAFVKADKSCLRMTVPDNKKSPYEYLDLEKPRDGNNPAIVSYLRKPGMIIKYETEGKWSAGLEKSSSDEYIIAVFVPDSDNIVTSMISPISLDEYLRQGEKADHTSWTDGVKDDQKFTIVERIQRGVSKQLKDSFNSSDEQIKARRSGALSKSLAKTLLPPVGFGASPSLPLDKAGNTDKKKSHKKSGKFTVTGSRQLNDGIVLWFESVFPKKKTNLTLEMMIDAEGGKKIAAGSWEDDEVIGTKFPVEITGIKIEQINSVNIEVLETQKYQVPNKVEIDVNDDVNEINGEIYLRFVDPMIQATLDSEFNTARREDEDEHNYSVVQYTR